LESKAVVCEEACGRGKSLRLMQLLLAVSQTTCGIPWFARSRARVGVIVISISAASGISTFVIISHVAGSAGGEG
jgi:hypothetical protein